MLSLLPKEFVPVRTNYREQKNVNDKKELVKFTSNWKLKGGEFPNFYISNIILIFFVFVSKITGYNFIEIADVLQFLSIIIIISHINNQ